MAPCLGILFTPWQRWPHGNPLSSYAMARLRRVLRDPSTLDGFPASFARDSPVHTFIHTRGDGIILMIHPRLLGKHSCIIPHSSRTPLRGSIHLFLFLYCKVIFAISSVFPFLRDRAILSPSLWQSPVFLLFSWFVIGYYSFILYLLPF